MHWWILMEQLVVKKYNYIKLSYIEKVFTWGTAPTMHGHVIIIKNEWVMDVQHLIEVWKWIIKIKRYITRSLIQVKETRLIFDDTKHNDKLISEIFWHFVNTPLASICMAARLILALIWGLKYIYIYIYIRRTIL